MDTPGFDPGNEERTYREIIRGIQSIRPFARISGLLYLTCIPQERFDSFDRKLIQFIRALCGDEYIPRVTFITTFWTVAGAEQAAKYNLQLEFLRSKWEQGVGAQELKLYQHGREYNVAGLDTGTVINWFTNREQIAQHAKEMVIRNYGGPTTVIPQIARELDANTPIQETDAGRLLGLRPRSQTPRSQTPRSQTPQSQTPQSQTPWFQPVLDVLGWVTRNVEFNVELGGTGQGQNFGIGNAYRGALGQFMHAFRKVLLLLTAC
jgi:hypothetical protein